MKNDIGQTQVKFNCVYEIVAIIPINAAYISIIES